MENRERVAKALLQAEGFLSGQQLSEELNITRAAVNKHIQSLREEGWEITSVPNRGYRLEARPRGLSAPVILAELHTSEIGQNLRILDEVDSTNRAAKEWARQGAPHGSAVLAKRQSAGRGRRGRSWASSEGGLYCSIVLRPHLATEKVPRLTLCAALAVREAIERTTGLQPGIKWPNDLLLGGKKLCGILTELSADAERLEFAVLGIGINVAHTDFPPEVRPLATSLADEGAAVERSELAAALFDALEPLLLQMELGGFSEIMEQYESRSLTLGKRVRILGVDGTEEGVAEAFDDLGMILLRKDDGSLLRIASGDVSLRPVEGAQP